MIRLRRAALADLSAATAASSSPAIQTSPGAGMLDPSRSDWSMTARRSTIAPQSPTEPGSRVVVPATTTESSRPDPANRSSIGSPSASSSRRARASVTTTGAGSASGISRVSTSGCRARAEGRPDAAPATLRRGRRPMAVRPSRGREFEILSGCGDRGHREVVSAGLNPIAPRDRPRGAAIRRLRSPGDSAATSAPSATARGGRPNLRHRSPRRRTRSRPVEA